MKFSDESIARSWLLRNQGITDLGKQITACDSRVSTNAIGQFLTVRLRVIMIVQKISLSVTQIYVLFIILLMRPQSRKRVLLLSKL